MERFEENTVANFHSLSWKEPYLETLKESDKEKPDQVGLRCRMGNVSSLAGTSRFFGRSGENGTRFYSLVRFGSHVLVWPSTVPINFSTYC
jgi:hypothetical protein